MILNVDNSIIKIICPCLFIEVLVVSSRQRDLDIGLKQLGTSMWVTSLKL